MYRVNLARLDEGKYRQDLNLVLWSRRTLSFISGFVCTGRMEKLFNIGVCICVCKMDYGCGSVSSCFVFIPLRGPNVLRLIWFCDSFDLVDMSDWFP